MKYLFAFSLAVLLVFINCNLHAQEMCCENVSDENVCCEETNGLYAEVMGGANFLQTKTYCGVKSDYRTGYIAAGAFGYRWCHGLRLEAEYAYRRNDFKRIRFFDRNFSLHGHYQSSSYMANCLWDIPTNYFGCGFWNIQPYIGAGIGYDSQKIHGTSEYLDFIQSKKGFAWQVMTGLSYPLSYKTLISFEYKFHKGKLNYIYNNSIDAGLTYLF